MTTVAGTYNLSHDDETADMWKAKMPPYNRDDLKRRQKAHACWHIQTNRCLSEGSDLHFAFTRRLVGVLGENHRGIC
jgi:hypothetical protein